MQDIPSLLNQLLTVRRLLELFTDNTEVYIAVAFKIGLLDNSNLCFIKKMHHQFRGRALSATEGAGQLSLTAKDYKAAAVILI